MVERAHRLTVTPKVVPMICALTLSAAAALLGLALEAPAPVSSASVSPSNPPAAVPAQRTVDTWPALIPSAWLVSVAASEGAWTRTAAAAPDDGRGTPYKVDKDDTICGLSEPRQLTNPAKVDYQALMDETGEIKELKRNKIDPSSAKGIELTTKARTKVRDACEVVRTNKSHCSIWKKISRRDRVAIADVTDAVKVEISGSGSF